MTATESLAILYSICSVCHLIEKKSIFSPLFLWDLFHIHKYRMNTSILLVNSENSCLMSALQKCIPSADRTDDIISFGAMQWACATLTVQLVLLLKLFIISKEPVCSLCSFYTWVCILRFISYFLKILTNLWLHLRGDWL